MKGIYLVKKHARLIWNRLKKIIIKKKLIPKLYVNRKVYFVDHKFIYGILKLKSPQLIGLSKFRDLKYQHFITEKERKKWWKGSGKLYLYKFQIIKLYKKPLPYQYKRGTQVVIHNVIKK